MGGLKILELKAEMNLPSKVDLEHQIYLTAFCAGGGLGLMLLSAILALFSNRLIYPAILAIILGSFGSTFATEYMNLSQSNALAVAIIMGFVAAMSGCLAWNASEYFVKGIKEGRSIFKPTAFFKAVLLYAVIYLAACYVVAVCVNQYSDTLIDSGKEGLLSFFRCRSGVDFSFLGVISL